MELSQQRAPDAFPLQRRIDVDPMELRLGAFAVVVQKADDPATLAGDEEVRAIGRSRAFDALAQSPSP